MESPFSRTHRTADLVQRARAGDRDAYDRLFALSAERVNMFLRLRLGPALKAKLEPQDVLQETYVEALAAFGRFEYEGDQSFARWLCRIAENRMRGLARHHRAKKRKSSAPEARVSEVIDRVRAQGTGPLTAAVRVETRERLEEALEQLEGEERDVLLMRFFEGCELAEIADRTGRSASSVRRLIGRSAGRLGVLLSPRETGA